MNQFVVEDPALDSGSRTERAYHRLRQEILLGDLGANDRLRVAELEERFGLGLTPIREALARLASEGLVSMEARRGARVLEISLAELADLMKTRREIERLCLTESIQHGDARWEAEVVAALHVLGRTPLPGSEGSTTDLEWEKQHRHFHAALVSACGSEWLLRFWNQLMDHSQRYRKARHKGPLVARDVQAEHQAILDAVLRRDAAAAVALMEQHLLATEKAARAALEQR
ncbi:GntR family transcriptional regulator [Hydrogenophaga sp. ANAO-22]|jgi:GntR family carbon starvation induced transcriptional regulator|uniref:GntR family transcriptional regulator n=1 Tax=Hydrogenophaga sp. ANAO-22 TaxID=3166645 RepID=UPI0036D33E03